MNIRDKVLLVEDERTIRSFMQAILTANGYDVLMAGTGAMANTMIASHCPDIIILDLGLPDMDGIAIIEKVRGWSGMPIIVISARSEDRDKIDALDAGADDYLGKPFDTRELLARLRALTRRPGTTAESAIRCGDVTLDAAQLTLSGPKAAAALTKREADLLEVLLRTPGQLQTRAVLLARVWGPLAEVEDANLDCYIHFVRRRLKAVGSAVTITTVRGSGYKAEVPPC